MGETVRWTQNGLRIFELIKSVNRKGTIPAQSSCLMASISNWAMERDGGENWHIHSAMQDNQKASSQRPFLLII